MDEPTKCDQILESPSANPMHDNDQTQVRRKTKERLERISQLFGLTGELKPGNAQIELRIWLATGLKYPECLIFKKTKGNWEGTHLYARDTALDKNALPQITRILIEPKSGWGFLDGVLLQRNIKLPLSSNMPDLNEPIADEGEILVQLREGAIYDYVSYRAFTSDPNGKSTIKLCEDLKQRLNISIDCIIGPAE